MILYVRDFSAFSEHLDLWGMKNFRPPVLDIIISNGEEEAEVGWGSRFAAPTQEQIDRLTQNLRGSIRCRYILLKPNPSLPFATMLSEQDTPTFMEAILASRKGATEMARGNYANSVQAFRQALLLLKSTVDSNAALPCLQSWRLTTMPVPTLQHEEVSYSSSCPMFDRFFLIMPMPCHEKIPTNDKVSLFSAALLFNIALVHQLHVSSSSLSSDSPQAFTETAMCLYTRSMQLLQGNLDRASDGAALMLAVSNNLATLALENMDWTSFNAYRSTMGHYLSITNTTGAFHAHFFAGNLSATENANKRPAPAA